MSGNVTQKRPNNRLQRTVRCAARRVVDGVKVASGVIIQASGREAFRAGEDGRQRIIQFMRDVFLARTQEEWLAFFEDRDVCLSPVNAPAAAFADPHIAARGTVVRAPGLRSVRSPFGLPSRPLHPARGVGQDTEEILRSLT